MDTAGSILTSETYYQAAKANALLIRPEDGDIRVFSKATPTSTLGTLLKSGTMYYFAGVDFTNFNLIRTSGSVACSIQLGLALAGESSFAAAADTVSLSLDEFPAAAALTDNFANPTTTSVAAMNMVWDGSTWDRMPGTSAEGTQVQVTRSSTATLTNVNDSATSATLLASTVGRKGAVIFNDSTVALYIKYGATASITSFSYKIAAGATWEMPTIVYTGIIDGIWDSDAAGAARITELT